MMTLSRHLRVFPLCNRYIAVPAEGAPAALFLKEARNTISHRGSCLEVTTIRTSPFTSTPESHAEYRAIWLFKDPLQGLNFPSAMKHESSREREAPWAGALLSCFRVRGLEQRST